MEEGVYSVSSDAVDDDFWLPKMINRAGVELTSPVVLSGFNASPTGHI